MYEDECARYRVPTSQWAWEKLQTEWRSRARAALAATPLAELVEMLTAQERAVDEQSKCKCRGHAKDLLLGMCWSCAKRYMRASKLRTAALARARGETP
jgi:hypothetical protein